MSKFIWITNSFWTPSCFRNLIVKRKLSCWVRTKAEHSTFILRKELKNSTTAWKLLEVSWEHESLLYIWCYLMKPAKKFIQIIAHSQGASGKKGPGTLSRRLHHSRLPGTNPVKRWINAAGSWKYTATTWIACYSFSSPQDIMKAAVFTGEN